MSIIQATEAPAPFTGHPIPAVACHRDSYRDTVRRGRRVMADSRIVLCGLARNVAHVLPLTRERLEQTGRMFADHRIFLYENDSEDETLRQLADWARANERMTFVSERRGRRQHASVRCCDRAADMAEYRNRCQQEVARRWSDFDYVCVVDTDLPGGWSDEGLAHTFGSEPWDFVGAYGIIHRRQHLALRALHYDVWAYREFGDYTPIDGRVGNAMRWSRGEPLIPVYSCFGGIGVYRLPAWLSAHYTGDDCEHVTLHRAMRAAGYDRQFLNPNQLAFYGRRQRRFDRVLLGLGSVVQSMAGFFTF